MPSKAVLFVIVAKLLITLDDLFCYSYMTHLSSVHHSRKLTVWLWLPLLQRISHLSFKRQPTIVQLFNNTSRFT